MDALISLGLLFVFLFAGMLLARIPRVAGSPWLKKISAAVLFGLLFFMGFRMGRTTEGTAELARVGLLSAGFALTTVLGTVVVLLLFFTLFREKEAPSFTSAIPVSRELPGSSGESSPAKSGSSLTIEPAEGAGIPVRRKLPSFFAHLKDPLRLFAFVAAGFLAGLLLPAGRFTGAEISTWMLRALLLSIGMDLTAGGVSFRAVLASKRTLLLPLGTALGSLLGGLLMIPLFGLSLSHSLSVSSGFGWYSLSGVLISDMGNPFLGSVAFMANILRETIALLAIPFLGEARLSYLAVGVGGATSMDVTLPLIERSCGAEIVPLSIASGAVLSLLVPVLVPLFYNLM